MVEHFAAAGDYRRCQRGVLDSNVQVRGGSRPGAAGSALAASLPMQGVR
jgi:hypothetical protein